ncbi:unnamed protein product [Arabidopsis lyrata]|uniref:DUF1997 family protein n=1 Tax=Arabidopsis lyrata subsp. lyrata TaxID=81972 RepID=D7MJK9_ARALL|nr:uncharacterized protein LOC9304784 [Arabidopsis lyrata subsp. lyrata]EFH44971.1 hypothetical protein ARALYDRAFT_916349 [Arabidopsis lyrata subsp. lyrata]CAH8277535.1 unnamed protein product [Arabidopsis lyrata]|eukprot:XP_002868712.1 uncharacterized protein LOC9304784 [Arabidopsis lyrata subsp. lyrata]
MGEMTARSAVLSSGMFRSYHRPVTTEVRSIIRSRVKCQVSSVKPATYSSKLSTDIPLHESPQALFDEYLEDKSRLFEAMFPDKPRSYRLNEEEWRIQMLPINFLFLTVCPVVDMRLRCKSNGQDYPPDVPLDITKVLELNMMRWKLKGLDRVMEPSDFSLEVKGALYPDRRGKQTRLRGQLEMNISFVLPPVLELVPEDVRRNLANAVLTGLVENMKHKVNGSLLADYSRFKNERKLQKVIE